MRSAERILQPRQIGAGEVATHLRQTVAAQGRVVARAGPSFHRMLLLALAADEQQVHSHAILSQALHLTARVVVDIIGVTMVARA